MTLLAVVRSDAVGCGIAHLENSVRQALLNPTKGFGFIQPGDGSKDVFVHISDVERGGLSTLNEGVVSFEAKESRGKMSAENLRVGCGPGSVTMPGMTKRMTPDRSKIDAQDAQQLKFWLKSLGVSKNDLLEAIDKVGNAAAAVRKELQGRGLAMPDNDKPLKPEAFPVNAEGKKIRRQDRPPIAETPDPAVATDVADRLNEDEARREEDKWSA